MIGCGNHELHVRFMSEARDEKPNIIINFVMKCIAVCTDTTEAFGKPQRGRARKKNIYRYKIVFHK